MLYLCVIKTIKVMKRKFISTIYQSAQFESGSDFGYLLDVRPYSISDDDITMSDVHSRTVSYVRMNLRIGRYLVVTTPCVACSSTICTSVVVNENA